MSTDTTSADSARLPLPEPLRPLATELETFYREFHRLHDEHGSDRYVVIKGDQIHGVWDTFRDATQYGYEKFEDGRFLAQNIDPRLLATLEQHFGPLEVRESA